MHQKQKGQRRLHRLAREMFGYEQLRPGQEAAARALLDGHDTLAVMPTGAGKSFIYQVAATLMSGPTVIVSPLIALQQDQVEQIEEQDVGRAALVNSTLRVAEWREVFASLKKGKLEYLFLAPEQFHHEETLQRIYEGDKMVVLFDSVGYKTLSINVVQERDLLAGK